MTTIPPFYTHFIASWVKRVVMDPRDWVLLLLSSIAVSPITGLKASICAGFPIAIGLDELLIRGYMLELHDIIGYRLNGYWVPTHELVITVWTTMCILLRTSRSILARRSGEPEIVYLKIKIKKRETFKY